MFDEAASVTSAMDPSDTVVRLAEGQRAIVELDPDHPGFRDTAYRERRNAIAQIAVDYQPGGPIPEAEYTPEEQGVWQTILEALRPAHERHACQEYRDYFERLSLPADRIPQLGLISKRIFPLSGFRLEPVAGLVTPRTFLSVLAQDTFLATQYIRHYSTPLYTPEPDVVHEVVGHAVLLASPIFGELNRLVGDAVLRTRSEEALDFLSRIFWYTVEFGVLREGGAIKAYGAGLLSSAGELEAMHQAEIVPTDFARMGRRPYDVTKFQPLLFCFDSFAALQEQLGGFLRSWSDEVALAS